MTLSTSRPVLPVSLSQHKSDTHVNTHTHTHTHKTMQRNSSGTNYYEKPF